MKMKVRRENWKEEFSHRKKGREGRAATSPRLPAAARSKALCWAEEAQGVRDMTSSCNTFGSDIVYSGEPPFKAARDEKALAWFSSTTEKCGGKHCRSLHVCALHNFFFHQKLIASAVMSGKK
jgi:hypothetical protein